jgi:hypothetical protein
MTEIIRFNKVERAHGRPLTDTTKKGQGAEIRPFDPLRALLRNEPDTAPSEYVAPDVDPA